MPKSNFEIKDFSAGIICNPEDERDIPTDAATYSKNIDPTVDGALSGIKKDKVLKATGFELNVVLTDWDQGATHASQSQAPIAYDPPTQQN